MQEEKKSYEEIFLKATKEMILLKLILVGRIQLKLYSLLLQLFTFT